MAGLGGRDAQGWTGLCAVQFFPGWGAFGRHPESAALTPCMDATLGR